jgi:RNA polymerase sigma factor (sigma-70 family)
MLNDAMQALTDRQRMVLMLRYEQGLTHAQVAEVLGVSLRAAEQLAKRALLVLRTQMRK